MRLDDDGNPMRTRPPKKRRARRKLTLAGVMRQAARAGAEVARYSIDPATGKIDIVTGKPETAASGNSWDDLDLEKIKRLQ